MHIQCYRAARSAVKQQYSDSLRENEQSRLVRRSLGVGGKALQEKTLSTVAKNGALFRQNF